MSPHGLQDANSFAQISTGMHMKIKLIHDLHR